MITNFDEYMKDLTHQEANYILPRVFRILEDRWEKDNAITSREIIQLLRIQGWFIDGSRLRKMIHLLRTKGDLTRLVATARGYFRTNEDEEYNKYLTSLNERISAQVALRNAMITQ